MTVSHPFPDIASTNNTSHMVDSNDDDDTERITNNNNNHDYVVSDQPVTGMEMHLDDNAIGDKGSCFRRRHKTLVGLGIAMFIMAIVGSLVGVLYNDSGGTTIIIVEDTSLSEDQEALLVQRQANDIYYRDLQKAIVRHVYRDNYQPSIFLNPRAIQLQAMQWMAYKDTWQFDLDTLLLLTTDNTEAVHMKRALLIQRYALMTLFLVHRSGGVMGVEISARDALDNGYTFNNDFDLGRLTNNATITTAEVNTTTLRWTPEQGIGVDECQWAFVKCDEQGRVTSLRLADYSIKDRLPPEIGLLHHLKHLDLSYNAWQGRLPTELYDLTHLETLNLSVNQFGGSISSHIGRLEKLKTLVINTNSFTGTVPSTLQALTSLETFHMGVNLLLGGPVLSYITADTLSRTLQDLDVSQTDTSGTIPTEVGKLTKLTNLGIWTVSLSGTIPSEIGAMTSLHRLQGGFFDVVGTLPTEVGLMTNLELFALKVTKLTGTIPSEIGTLTDARAFLFSETLELQGSIPSEIGLMKALEVFHVSNTDVQGTIPTEMGLLEHASDVRLYYTLLSGTVPDEICNLPPRVLMTDCIAVPPELQPEIECEDGCCTCIHTWIKNDFNP